MVTAETLSFCPHWLTAEGVGEIPCRMRRFGLRAADLEVEFRAALRPDLITRLLAQCCQTAAGHAAERRVLQRMPVGMRIEGLLILASLTDPSPFSWQTRCSSPGCGREIEFDLRLDQVISLADEQRGSETCTHKIECHEIVLRRPTSEDQLQWIAAPIEAQPEVMLRSILLKPSLDELLVAGLSLESIDAAVDEAMDDFDPLVSFHLSVICFNCDCSSTVFPDLTGLALERLSHAQQSLISDVHLLASRYHWSESEVLALPEWRRHMYLELVEEGAQL